MTLRRFQELLKKIDPRLRVRQRGRGDIGGIFVGLSGKSGYIARITRGELTTNGYRVQLIDPQNKMAYVDGKIKKRGRKTLINLLRNYRWLRHHTQRTMLMFGIEYPEIENEIGRVLLHG